jgi:hypothetical protein
MVPTPSGTQHGATEFTKGGSKPMCYAGYAWCWLNPWARGKALPERPAFQPYWGKPAVRNDGEEGGNVGIMRSPLRASFPTRPSHTDPESCVVSREAGHEALTGAHAGGVSSREISGNQDADAVYSAGRQHWWVRYREHLLDLRGQRPPTCMEPPRARTGRPYQRPTRSCERAGRGR